MNLEKRFFGMDGGSSTLYVGYRSSGRPCTISSFLPLLCSGVKLSFLASLIYYSQHPAALSRTVISPSMTLDDARILVAALLVGWSLIAELWKPINLFGIFESILGYVFLNKEQYAVWADQVSPVNIPVKPGKPVNKGKEPAIIVPAHHDASPATLRNRKKKK